MDFLSKYFVVKPFNLLCSASSGTFIGHFITNRKNCSFWLLSDLSGRAFITIQRQHGRDMNIQNVQKCATIRSAEEWLQAKYITQIKEIHLGLLRERSI